MAGWVAAMKAAWLSDRIMGPTMLFIVNIIKYHLHIEIYSHSIWSISCLFPHCWSFLPPYNLLSFFQQLAIFFLRSTQKGSVSHWVFVYEHNGYDFPSKLCIGSWWQERSVTIKESGKKLGWEESLKDSKSNTFLKAKQSPSAPFVRSCRPSSASLALVWTN